MKEREIAYARWIRSSSSRSPSMPSMSLPRWTCASKSSAPGGNSARTTSSKLDETLRAPEDVLHERESKDGRRSGQR